MLNSKVLTKLAVKITNEVTGEWIIFGGSALYLLGIDSRSTIDVDIASFQTSTNEDSLKLMTIAQDLKLPIETINQAGAFFLNKIDGWQSRCKLSKKGKLGRVYIPNVDLYFELKAARMSSTDLADCLAYLAWAKKTKLKFDEQYIIEKLRAAHLHANQDQKKRLEQLISAVDV